MTDTLDHDRVDIRSLTGLVCPRCRLHQVEASPPIVLCPRDGFALVAPSVLAGADGDPLLGLLVANRYAVLGKIGRGSTGTVYRAFDTKQARNVALKVLRTEWTDPVVARDRIEREARVLSLLRSAHTVKLLDRGQVQLRIDDDVLRPESSLFLVMEMLEGEPLIRRLERSGRLTVDEAIRWASHALESLAEAHDWGIVHRDITPSNLFLARVTDDLTMGKVVDFGLAVFASEAPSACAAGTPIGTPRYMSPEQARGEVLDGRSDLYSVGLLMYQMLTGRPPFTDGEAFRVLWRHIHEIPDTVSNVAPDAKIPTWLSRLVAAMMEKRREDRPSGARVVLGMLAAGGEAVGSGP